MIQEHGVVVRVENQRVWVETQRKTACDSCSANKGCGTATLSKVVGNKPNVIELSAQEAWRVGESVILGMDERELVKGSFAVYMVPLLFVLVFAALGELLRSYATYFTGEGLTVLFALIGLGCGFFWVRYRTVNRRCQDDAPPVVVKKGVL